LLVPSSSHHPARTRLRFFPQALIAGFGYPLHDVPPQRVQLLTQPVFEVAIVGPTLEHVDHDLEELQKEFHGRPHLRSTMSTRPVQDGEVFFLSIPFHSLCYSNVTRLPAGADSQPGSGARRGGFSSREGVAGAGGETRCGRIEPSLPVACSRLERRPARDDGPTGWWR